MEVREDEKEEDDGKNEEGVPAVDVVDPPLPYATSLLFARFHDRISFRPPAGGISFSASRRRGALVLCRYLGRVE